MQCQRQKDVQSVIFHQVFDTKRPQIYYSDILYNIMCNAKPEGVHETDYIIAACTHNTSGVNIIGWYFVSYFIHGASLLIYKPYTPYSL